MRSTCAKRTRRQRTNTTWIAEVASTTVQRSGSDRTDEGPRRVGSSLLTSKHALRRHDEGRLDAEAESRLHLLSELRGACVLTNSVRSRGHLSVSLHRMMGTVLRCSARTSTRSSAPSATRWSPLSRRCALIRSIVPTINHGRGRERSYRDLRFLRAGDNPAHPSAVPGRGRRIEWEVVYTICWSPGQHRRGSRQRRARIVGFYGDSREHLRRYRRKIERTPPWLTGSRCPTIRHEHYCTPSSDSRAALTSWAKVADKTMSINGRKAPLRLSGDHRSGTPAARTQGGYRDLPVPGDRGMPPRRHCMHTTGRPCCQRWMLVGRTADRCGRTSRQPRHCR